MNTAATGNQSSVYMSSETIEDKIRKYTRPHPIVTSHLRNYRANNVAAHKVNTNNKNTSVVRSIPPELLSAAAFLRDDGRGAVSSAGINSYLIIALGMFLNWYAFIWFETWHSRPIIRWSHTWNIDT